jgi:hypothetical protein
MAGVAYFILQSAIIASQGPNSLLASAVGRDWKGNLSPAIYLVAVPLAFVSPWISSALYTTLYTSLCTCVVLLWLVPDRRIERVLRNRDPGEA